MIDLYLMAGTEAEMLAELIVAGVINDEGFPAEGISLDHIGPFSRVTGYNKPTREADDPIPIVVDYPGWHTNLRGNFTDEQIVVLEPLSVQPAVPYRVWA
jgi:hypothetical protein